ncbi:Beta-ketoacyl-acyl-carrier-protein synthase I [Actinobacteria bacterium OV450]|nr:Beta-ketoacyl-acyl-carrier-protein synthase I [Actinobacteria bacterium OV450]
MVTPSGVGTAATWEGLCSGRSFATPDPALADYAVDFSCMVTGFDPRTVISRQTALRTDPFTHFVLAAAQEATVDAGLTIGSDVDALRVGIVLGCSSNSSTTYLDVYRPFFCSHPEEMSPLTLPRSLPNMAADETAIHLGARGPVLTLATACTSGANAIGIARDLIRSGSCDVVLAGGAESIRTPSACIAFHRLRALSTRRHDPAGASRPFDRDRDGFVLSEGAAVLVLERLDHARARHARPKALVAGYATASDAHHPIAPHPDGRGLRHAMHAALADAGLTPPDIDMVTAHATGTPLGDLTEARALHHTFAGSTPPVTAPKGAIGHPVGASGAIQAALAVLALSHQRIPPTANLDNLDPDVDLDVVTKVSRPQLLRHVLANASGFGGSNTALVLHHP